VVNGNILAYQIIQLLHETSEKLKTYGTISPPTNVAWYVFGLVCPCVCLCVCCVHASTSETTDLDNSFYFWYVVTASEYPGQVNRVKVTGAN